MDSKCITIHNIGKYYVNPVVTQYDNLINNVVCLSCKRSNLTICIGLDKESLCLKCVETVDNFLKNKNNKVDTIDGEKVMMMMQGMYHGGDY